jgi:hypothetical protein
MLRILTASDAIGKCGDIRDAWPSGLVATNLAMLKLRTAFQPLRGEDSFAGRIHRDQKEGDGTVGCAQLLNCLIRFTDSKISIGAGREKPRTLRA